MSIKHKKVMISGWLQNNYMTLLVVIEALGAAYYPEN